MSTSVLQLFSSLSSQFLHNFDISVMGVFLFTYTVLQLAVRQLAPYPKNVQNLKNPKKEYELYYAEIVSVLHAFLSLGICIYIWSQLGLALNQSNKPEHFYLFAHQVAYFTVDFTFSIIFGYNDVMNTVHHVTSIFTTSVIFFLHYGGAQSTLGVFIAQISNPFLQTRNTLRRYGKDSGVFYQYLEYLFVFTFLLCRLVLPVPIIFLVYSQNNCPIIIQVASSSLYSISMIWNLQITNKLWKAIKDCLTHQGSKKLSPLGKQIDSLVKFMVFSIPGKVIAMSYALVVYYALPVWLFILPRL